MHENVNKQQQQLLGMDDNVASEIPQPIPKPRRKKPSVSNSDSLVTVDHVDSSCVELERRNVPPPRRKKSSVSTDGLVTVDHVTSSSVELKQRNRPPPPAPISSSTPRDAASSSVKLKPIRPELPKTRKMAVNCVKSPKVVGMRTMRALRTRSLSISSDKVGKENPTSCSRSTKGSKTAEARTTASSSSKYLYSPFSTARSSSFEERGRKLAPPAISRPILMTSGNQKKPVGPMRLGFESSTLPPREQTKSPKYSRVKPARPACPPKVKNDQIYDEVISVIIPPLRPPARIPLAQPVVKDSIDYTYVDPQKVLYRVPPCSEGLKRRNKAVNNVESFPRTGKILWVQEWQEELSFTISLCVLAWLPFPMQISRAQVTVL